MKKIISIILICSMILSMCACGESNVSNVDDNVISDDETSSDVDISENVDESQYTSDEFESLKNEIDENMTSLSFELKSDSVKIEDGKYLDRVNFYGIRGFYPYLKNIKQD